MAHVYRGYRISPQLDGVQIWDEAADELIDTAPSATEAEKIIDGWHDAK